MKITVTENEIKNAVLDRMRAQGIVIDGYDIAVGFTMARRNGAGLSATVDLSNPNDAVIPNSPTVDEEEDTTVLDLDSTTSQPETKRFTVGNPIKQKEPTAPAVKEEGTPVAPAPADQPVLAEKPVELPSQDDDIAHLPFTPDPTPEAPAEEVKPPADEPKTAPVRPLFGPRS